MGRAAAGASTTIGIGTTPLRVGVEAERPACLLEQCIRDGGDEPRA